MDKIPSFEQAVAILSPALGRYLERMLGNSADAEDLMQEVLIKIGRGLPRFEGRSSLETWAYSIATRTVTDHLRRPANRHGFVELEAADEPCSDEPELEQRLIVDEMNTCVREVIDSLPEDYRAALVLHDLESKTAAQVAEISGCSLATAKIRIHRARARLERAMSEQCSFYRTADDVLHCDRKGE